jgi:hypothetical protein
LPHVRPSPVVREFAGFDVPAIPVKRRSCPSGRAYPDDGMIPPKPFMNDR